MEDNIKMNLMEKGLEVWIHVTQDRNRDHNNKLSSSIKDAELLEYLN
jgi:hypothetical protein